MLDKAEYSDFESTLKSLCRIVSYTVSLISAKRYEIAIQSQWTTNKEMACVLSNVASVYDRE